MEKTKVEVAELQKELDTVSTQLEDCLNLSHGYINVQRDITDGLEAAVNNTEEIKNEEDEVITKY